MALNEAITRVVRPAGETTPSDLTATAQSEPRFVTKWVPVKAAEPPADGVAAGKSDVSRPLVMVASLETEDRAGDLVRASGWDLRAYESNPIVLWAHEYSRPAIGRSLRTRIDGDALVAEVEFAPTPFAQEVRALYLAGFMRGVSVGFRALETEPRTASNGRPATLFKRQELLEISAAPVPLNPDALAHRGSAAYSNGIPDIDLAGMDAAADSEATVEALREIGEIWHEMARLTGDE